MESTLPFEYGCLYKPINGVYQQEWIRDYNMQPTVTNSGGASVAYPYISNIDSMHYFNPIAFIESTQRVIGEVYAKILSTHSYLIQSNNSYYNQSTSFGINFSNVNYQTEEKKLVRVEIDVNEFIKGFEKVL